MFGSTAVPFKKALKAGLTAALAPVQVQYADDPEKAKKERVYLGQVESGESSPVAMRAGRRPREESYDVHVFVEVIGARRTPEANEERASALVELIGTWLADNPKADTPAVRHALLAGLEMSTTETTDGPRTLVDLTVTVTADLRQ